MTTAFSGENTNELFRLAASSILAGVTFALIGRMLWFLRLSASNALRNDQWPMLEEIRGLGDGRLGWSYLWVPYWGHRIVIPRLILLADERWFGFSNAPLILINVLALSGSAAILMMVAGRLLGRSFNSVTMFSLTVIAGLMLSSIQLENIVYGMAVQNTIAFISAIAAIAAMGQSSRRGWLGAACVSLAVASALISTLCFGAGLLLWPVLVAEGLVLHTKLRVTFAIAVTGVVLTAIYLWGYTNAAMGMGGMGLFRRPWDAALIAGTVLGGPFSNVNVWLGAAIGGLGFVFAIRLLFELSRTQSPVPVEFATLLAVLIFVIGCAFSVSAARISPEWLAKHPKPLPGRYLTFAYIFWSSALPLAIFDFRRGRYRVISTCAIFVPGSLLIGFIPAQLDASEQWLRTYRLIDAAASGFFIGATDQTYMSQMYPDDFTLARDVPFLREHRLSVFAEPREEWVGRKLTDLYQVGREMSCYGNIEETPLSVPGRIRLTGYVKTPELSNFDKTDLLFVDSSGQVAGIGRTLFENDRQGERFIGYAWQGTGDLTTWIIEDRYRICRVR